jgi:predicted porin
MKKTLVALAAIASVSAFAQTTVSITGNLDFAGARFGGTMSGNKGTTITTGNGTASTSAINFTATEDIGGGNKITAFYGLDPRTLANDSLSSTNTIGSTTTGANAVTVTGLARHEAYVQASGGFGSIKVGAPNAPSLDANGIGNPLGTGVGSGWATHSNTLVNRSANARYSRSARFDTPVMNGISGHLVFAPGGDQANVNDASSTYGAFQFPNARRATEAALKYSNGPVNLMVVNIRGAAYSNVNGYYSYSNEGATTTSIASTNYNTVAANYNLGNTTIYAQMGNGGSINKHATAAKLASDKLSRYAVKHTMGAVDLSVVYTKVASTTADTTTTTNEIVSGFNGTYNLSKTSAVYLGYEKYDSGTVGVTTNTTSGIRTITSLGLRKSF